MKNKKNYLIILGILILSLGTFIYNSKEILNWLLDSQKTKNITSSIKKVINEENTKESNDFILINPPDIMEDNYWLYTEEEFLKNNINDLLNENKDTVGWIKVNGTNVDYPVVQTLNNEYYLKRSFDQTKNKAGWIFSDYRNNLDNLNANSIIYGHKRKDKTMFGTLDYLFLETWLNDKNNYLIKLQTLNNNYIWQIFSVYTTYLESYYLKTNFLNKEEFSKFLDTIKNRSFYDFNTIVNSDDKILTLSTCLDNNGNRIVVHAKLIKKEILN